MAEDEKGGFNSLIEGVLTAEKAAQALEFIKWELNSFEDAHIHEEALMTTFVRQIADGTIADIASIKAIADIIKKVNALKFPRYYA